MTPIVVVMHRSPEGEAEGCLKPAWFRYLVQMPKWQTLNNRALRNRATRGVCVVL